MPIPPPKKSAVKLHIQNDLIAMEDGPQSDFTSKITAPFYSPKNRKPEVIELVNQSKSKLLISRIMESKVSDAEKKFLVEAAKRHNVFNYALVADYYAHASAEMQSLMEDSALVIIDFDKAIKNGYVKFSDEIEKIYVKEYEQRS